MLITFYLIVLSQFLLIYYNCRYTILFYNKRVLLFMQRVATLGLVGVVLIHTNEYRVHRGSAAMSSRLNDRRPIAFLKMSSF